MNHNKLFMARIIKVIISYLICLLYCMGQSSGTETGHINAYEGDAEMLFSEELRANPNSLLNNSAQSNMINSYRFSNSCNNKTAKGLLKN